MPLLALALALAFFRDALPPAHVAPVVADGIDPYHAPYHVRTPASCPHPW